LRQGARRFSSAGPNAPSLANQAGLIDLWRSNVKESHLFAVEVESVTTNHRGLTNNDVLICIGAAGQRQKE
jgi:hypothetical protein